jgi:hypothetical protein
VHALEKRRQQVQRIDARQRDQRRRVGKDDHSNAVSR